MSALRLGQWQEAGGAFINQSKDIMITVVAAMGVIAGDLTLGMMLAIQYIIGQLNGPLAQMVNFVLRLPLGVNTMIGARGNGISQGQKQRLLIARAVYKNPAYLFLDEATNALDANNEQAITKQLSQFYSGKTVVIVAHRLSTVLHADQIVVLDKGEIVELGSHQALTAKKGAYYALVKNQLELGT